MRLSQLFGRTLRQPPAEAEAASYVWLARGGYLRPNESGDFTLLPLGQRTLNHLLALVSSEVEKLGGQQISRVRDIRTLAETEVGSYRHLPRLLYTQTELKTKPPHPRLGLLGAVHSPTLKVFALNPSQKKLEQASNALDEIAQRLFDKLQLPILSIETDSDAANTDAVLATGLAFVCEAGDRELLLCPACNYGADQAAARRAKSAPAAENPQPLEEVCTPDCHTIESLAQFLKIPQQKTAKAVFLMARLADSPEEKFVFAVLRGDMELSEAKLTTAIGALSMRPATEPEIRAVGAEPGYASPVGIKEAFVVVDDLIPESPNLVAGANRAGYHLRNVNCGRDYLPALVTDLVQVKAGDPCPNCEQPLETIKGTQLTHSVRVDPAKSPTYTDENGQPAPLWIETVSFDLGRTLAAAAEIHHDEGGLHWPAVVAPYDLHLVVLAGKQGDTRPAADQLYSELQEAGISVLYDERDERAGVKFNDADLIGLPLRLTVGERNLGQGMVELKRRTADQGHLVAMHEIVQVLEGELPTSE
jgi:prolyl-tRNA synthetase